MKRAVDLLGAILALLILAPVLAVVAVVSRAKLGSPILFRQERPGLHGKPFTLLKFRTMESTRGPDGQLLPDAERLSVYGRFLRAASLDELPEFLNVLKGDLSLVGPRPLLMEYLPLYTAEQMRRHDVKPGLTGWAQIHGRNACSWKEKFELDRWYVDNRSFWLDVQILLRTIWQVIARQGISAGGHATMPRFTGAGLAGTDSGEGATEERSE